MSPITAQEALLSSKIEGTQATLDEVLEADAGVLAPDARRGDIEEITNYRAAVTIAEQALEHRPITLALIREAHQRLLQGVRGRDKAPGRFRTDQNWIGNRGDPIERARFIPPSPLILENALDDWQVYIALPSEDPVLQTAIAHAQFEIIHPFKDGNGRVGRMLIPLILYGRGALSRPMFYMSEYLESNRQQYYDRLLGITRDRDWFGWIDFFLTGIISQAESNLSKVKDIHALHEATHKKVFAVTQSKYAKAVVDTFFTRPIISASLFTRAAGFNNRMTAYSILRQLEAARVMSKIREGSGRVAAVYAFSELINITEGSSVLQERQPRLL